jgi:hypothetical protein
MVQATATPRTMMDQGAGMMAGATPTPEAMMDHNGAMSPSTLPVTGGAGGFPWPIALGAVVAILLAGAGLRLARAAR